MRPEFQHGAVIPDKAAVLVFTFEKLPTNCIPECIQQEFESSSIFEQFSRRLRVSADREVHGTAGQEAGATSSCGELPVLVGTGNLQTSRELIYTYRRNAPEVESIEDLSARFESAQSLSRHKNRPP